MPILTNAEKRVARIERLGIELQSKTAIHTAASRIRCIAACRELIEQLNAETVFQRARAAVVRLSEQSPSAEGSSDVHEATARASDRRFLQVKPDAPRLLKQITSPTSRVRDESRRAPATADNLAAPTFAKPRL